MQYGNRYPMDDNLRVLQCPRCENEQFSDNANYCKICGANLFNNCLGIPEEDNHGNQLDYLIFHKNLGDARFCETCGEKTQYFDNGFLKSWEEEKQILEQNEGYHAESNNDTNNNYDDVPF